MKVLIVDDRQDNLYMLEILLKGNGFSVISARNGNEALRLARSDPPGLVISDILMPGMDGFAFCREWKKDPDLRAIPFVFYTATYTDPKDEKLAANMGADRFILKPVEPDVFIEQIRSVLEEAGNDHGVPVREALEPDVIVMKEYNEALVRKLEDKLEQIDSLVAVLNGKEKKLLHTVRVLKGIRAVNQLIVKEKRRDVLIREACERLVRDNGYKGAWIVLDGVKPGENMYSHAGFSDSDFSRMVDLFEKGDKPPCCRDAIEKNGIVLTPGFQHCHGKCPMSETCGSTVSMAVPLEHEERIFGFLVVSLPPHIAADDDEISLLNEMASDIAFSLHNIGLEEDGRKSLDLIRLTFESANDGIILADQDSLSFVRVNRAMCEMLGYAPEEMEKLHIDDIHPASDLPRVLEGLEKQFSGEKSLASNIPLQRKDGSIFFADVNASPLLIDGRNHLLGIFRDVTRRMEAEEKEHAAMKRLDRALQATIHVLAQVLERKDPYTSGHQRRVAALAGAIASGMGLGEESVDGIIMAGQIHDIGKVSVPAEILSKPGPLSPLEMQLIREHPAHGKEILEGVDSPVPLGDIVLQHHERLDGSGYPQGLKGDDILLEARILAVADVVEAMASHRPYRPSRGIEEALLEIEANRGTQYDRDVVDTCLRLFREEGYSLVD